MNCEHCQTLLLDHLYDLLDRDEAAAVDTHLAGCPACADARAETARVQGLIARAAKSTFPDTYFTPPPAQKSELRPVTAPAQPSVPGRAGEGKGGWRVAAVVPWVVAAAVLLAVPSTVVPVLNTFRTAAEEGRAAEAADREVAAAARAVEEVKHARTARLGDAEMRLATAEQARVALLDRWLAEQKAVAQAAFTRKLNVNVLKPATVQPGAPNDFLLVVRDERDGSARRSRLVAEVRASDAVVFTQPLDHEKRGNQHPIRLPASVWTKLKPDAELTLVVAEVDEKTQARTALQEIRLAGPVFTTLLTTDKPVYRPGERLFFRSLTLDRVTLKPPATEQALRYDLIPGTNPNARVAPVAVATGTTGLVRVGHAGGKVEVVRVAGGQPVRGVGCGEFVLPPDLADGEYTLVLREVPTGPGGTVTLPVPVTRTVKVRSGTRDLFAKQLGYSGARSFASGDLVEAWAELKTLDQPVVGAEVVGVVVTADGVPVPGVEAAHTTDALGRAKLRFALPDEVLDGDVRVKVTFRSADGVESVADRVPVVSRRLHVEFFPEGGDAIVAGVPCRAYVRATTPAGQPVDISGVVTDGRQTLATVTTLRDAAEQGANRGLASFTFTPQAGVPTWLKLDAPHGVYAPVLVDAPVKVAEVAVVGGAAAIAGRTGFKLPDARLDGVVMSVPDTVTEPGQPIKVHLYSVGQPRTLVVGAYVRGRLADTQKVLAEPGQLTEAKLMAGSDPRGGVVRVTAFEEVDAKNDPDRPDLKPVAERLVFRRPGEVLNLSLAVSSPEARAFVPGTPVVCAVAATDEKNNPAAAVLWAAVVNTGVAPGAKDRALPTHFLLAGDVQSPEDLEYADFLLTDHPKAREALDLVLGTQGWRRFAEQSPLVLAAGKAGLQPTPLLPGGSDLTRLLVQNGQHAVLAEQTVALEARRLADTYAPLYEAAVQAVTKARAVIDQTHESDRDQSDVQQAQASEAAVRRAAAEQERRTGAARESVERFRSGAWYGVAGFAALALLCGGVSLNRPRARLPLGFSTVGSFGLAAFLVIAAGWDTEVRGDRSVAKPAPATADAWAPRVERAEPELAPAPRLKRAPEVQNMASAASGLAWDGKPEGGAKLSGGAAGGGGFGAAALPAPAGPGGLRQPNLTQAPTPIPPPKAPAVAPPAGRAHERFAPGAVPDPVAPLAAPKMLKAASGGPAGPIDMGWAPIRPSTVTAADLARSEPDLQGRSRSRPSSDWAVVQLQKATAEANRFAHERQRKLTEALDALSGNRTAPAVGPDNFTTQAYNAPLFTPEKIEALALRQIRGAVPVLPPLVVREYAQPRPVAAVLADAGESPDTILWQPVVVLPADGKAVLNFALGDARGYRIVVAGHTPDGRLGEARAVIAVQPLVSRTNPQIVTTPPGGAVPTTVPPAPGPRP
ncbi:hypothetical protein R5W23_003814 [Gemmata sp. JC673]|uniref:Putative zinc-finger domain-containing protein n=1 Tax=Gemmata algarum TaxID=2975278 RepID=A0ABU5F7P6_9BACT|nr:zf-HC2 domain-containing protein [Gemmata algarum]MDY3562348.1 hypothetical protein [Gemmata algarum]